MDTQEEQQKQLETLQGEYIGYVKWFDDAKGYGYIHVVSEGERYGTDVFVHQSNIRPSRSTYRTLHNSETVTFNLSDEEQPQALEVHGVNGRLFCDSVMYRRPRRKTSTHRSSST